MLFDPNWAPPKVEVEPKEWQKVLLKAADILEEKGWIRNNMHRNGRSCTLGAIEYASEALGARDRAVQSATSRVTRFIRKKMLKKNPYMTEYKYMSIPRWNDRYAKDTKEVVETLRTVAKMEKI